MEHTQTAFTHDQLLEIAHRAGYRDYVMNCEYLARQLECQCEDCLQAYADGWQQAIENEAEQK